MLGLSLKVTWPAVFGGGGSVASGYDPASDAIFASFTTPPTTQRKTAIDNCVVALKAGGVWAKLDVLYALGAADSQAAKINWKAPGTYTLVEVSGPTFAADVGFTGGGVSYLDTTFNPTIAPSPKYLRDDASIFAWSLSNIDSNGGIIGFNSTVTSLVLARLSNLCYFYVNDGGAYTFPNTDGSGFFSGSRRGATAKEVYKDGVSKVATPLSSTPLINGAVCLLRHSNIWPGTATFGGFGSQLSTAEHVALYNALAGYLADIAVEKIVAAFTTPPTAGRVALIRACVLDLVKAGIWNKLDALYAFAAADSQAAKVNWKQPGTYNATEVGAPAFAADQGFTGAASKYLDSLFLPTTAPSPKYVLDSANLFAWSLTSTALDADIAGADTSAAVAFQPRRTSNVNIVRMHQGTTNISVASTDATGLWADDRSSSVLTTCYRNGVSQGTNAAASTTLANFKLSFLKGQGTFWAGQIAAGGFGQSLSGAEHTALYNALNAYMTGLFSYQAETNAIAAAFTTPPTTARKNLIDQAVVALKTAGVWTKLDALYLFAAADSQAAKINWIAPGTYNASEVSAPAFAADLGFTGAAASYLDSGFNPTTAPTPKYLGPSASAFGWSLTAGQLTAGAVGLVTGNMLVVRPRSTTDLAQYVINRNSGFTVDWANTDGLGSYISTRTGNPANTIYKNGVSMGAGGGSPTGVPTENIVFLTRMGAYWLGQIAAGGIGGALTDPEALALHNALRTYMTGVGIP